MKKYITLLFLFTLFIGLSGCKKADAKPTLHVGLMRSMLSVPYYYADEHHLFEKYGVNVDLKLFGSAKDRDDYFQGDKINAVSTDLVAAMLYLKSGKDIVITSQTEEEFRLVTNKENNATSLDNITKADIGISENTVVEYLVDHVMKEHNVTYVTPSQFKTSTATNIYTKEPISNVHDRFVYLNDNKINMAIMPEPFPSLTVANEGKELWNNIDENLYATCFVVDKKFADDNYEMIKNFNKAINEAIKDLHNISDEDYNAIVTNPDHELIPSDAVNLVERQDFHPLVNPNIDTFNDVLAWCKSKNLITKDYDLHNIIFPYQLENLS